MDDSIQLVRKCFDDSKEYMSPYFDRCNKWYSVYRAMPDPGLFNITTRAQYVVPTAYKTVETILPRVMQVIFSTSPPIQSRFRVSPPEGSPELKLRAIDQMFEYYKDRLRLFWVYECGCKDSMIYGQAYWKVGWRHRKQTVSVERLVPTPEGDLLPVEQEEDRVIQDEVDVQNVDVRDLYFSRDAKFPDPFGSAKYVIHVTRKRKSEVLAMRDAGIYNDFEDDELPPQKIDEYTPESQKASSIDRAFANKKEDEDPLITIYEYWEDDRVITTADHSVLLRDEPNPFKIDGRPPRKPFVACVDTLVPGELFQIGEVEPLEHNQIENSTLRRQRTDNNSLIINKMFLYNKSADVDLEAMRLARPGGGVGASPIDGVLANAIIPIVQGDINGASYKEQQALDQDAQDISGLLDYAVGSAPERRETATTVQLLQTAANQRFGLKVQHYSQAFVELANMIYERVYQFQTEPLPLRIAVPGQTGFQYVEVDKNFLPHPDEIDLAAPGSPEMLLRDARHQKMMQIVQMLRELPTVNPQAVHEMFKLALKEMSVDGMEKVIALLEIPTLTMMPEAQAASGLPPMPERPSGTAKGVNEVPIGNPMPSPSR